jgi:regulator of protease activity HflC (stomatin/prohibitin superfamily)
MYEPLSVLILTVSGLLIYKSVVRKTTVYEYQKGLLYTDGKFKRLLEPGNHHYLKSRSTVSIVDMRSCHFTLPGQEVLTSDNVSLKLSISIQYRLGDPEKASHKVQNYYQSLYAVVQLALRNAVSRAKVDELLEKRLGIGKDLLEESQKLAVEFGLIIEAIDVKDVMFPGELKKIFAEVVRAQKEGQAALERARGEQAALRSLANAAKLLEDNPALMNLRILQSLSNSNSGTSPTVVLGVPQGLVPLSGKGNKGNTAADSN